MLETLNKKKNQFYPKNTFNLADRANESDNPCDAFIILSLHLPNLQH